MWGFKIRTLFGSEQFLGWNLPCYPPSGFTICGYSMHIDTLNSEPISSQFQNGIASTEAPNLPRRTDYISARSKYCRKLLWPSHLLSTWPIFDTPGSIAVNYHNPNFGTSLNFNEIRLKFKVYFMLSSEHWSGAVNSANFNSFIIRTGGEFIGWDPLEIVDPICMKLERFQCSEIVKIPKNDCL